MSSTSLPEIYVNTWNFRGYPLERAVRKAKAFGYDGIEIWSGHYQFETVETTLADAQRLGREVGIAIPVLNLSGNVIDADSTARAVHVRRIAEIIDRCPEFGIRIVNGYAGSIVVDRNDWGKNGSAAASAEHYDRATEAYQTLGAAAQRAGLLLTLEVHMNTIHDTAASAARLLDRIGSPAVRANFDAGNMYGTSRAEKATEAIAILGSRIAYTHYKNARRDPGRPAGIDYHYDLPGGDLDYYAITRTLHQSGFRGPYAIEYSGAGDRAVVTRNDLRYLREVLTEVAAEAPEQPTSERRTAQQEPL
jgi:sugar phosphate isomerase/epimerase